MTNCVFNNSLFDFTKDKRKIVNKILKVEKENSIKGNSLQ